MSSNTTSTNEMTINDIKPGATERSGLEDFIRAFRLTEANQ